MMNDTRNQKNNISSDGVSSNGNNNDSPYTPSNNSEYFSVKSSIDLLNKTDNSSGDLYHSFDNVVESKLENNHFEFYHKRSESYRRKKYLIEQRKKESLAVPDTVQVKRADSLQNVPVDEGIDEFTSLKKASSQETIAESLIQPQTATYADLDHIMDRRISSSNNIKESASFEDDINVTCLSNEDETNSNNIKQKNMVEDTSSLSSNIFNSKATNGSCHEFTDSSAVKKCTCGATDTSKDEIVKQKDDKRNNSCVSAGESEVSSYLYSNYSQYKDDNKVSPSSKPASNASESRRTSVRSHSSSRNNHRRQSGHSSRSGQSTNIQRNTAGYVNASPMGSPNPPQMPSSGPSTIQNNNYLKVEPTVIIGGYSDQCSLNCPNNRTPIDSCDNSPVKSSSFCCSMRKKSPRQADSKYRSPSAGKSVATGEQIKEKKSKSLFSKFRKSKSPSRQPVSSPIPSGPVNYAVVQATQHSYNANGDNIPYIDSDSSVPSSTKRYSRNIPLAMPETYTD